jgi:hypothetical protein
MNLEELKKIKEALLKETDIKVQTELVKALTDVDTANEDYQLNIAEETTNSAEVTEAGHFQEVAFRNTQLISSINNRGVTNLFGSNDFLDRIREILSIGNVVDNRGDANEGIIDTVRGVGEIFNPSWSTNFSELKSQLKTGDIILVHGKYPYSWLIQLLQWSKWGHSAMVVLAKDIDPQNSLGLPKVMLWESNTKDLGVKNVWGDNKTVKDGPMLISLEERLKNSAASSPDVQIAHRPLHLDMRNQPIDFSYLKTLFDDLIEKKFPDDKDVIYSVYLGRNYNRTMDDPASARVILNRNINTNTLEVLGQDNNSIRSLPSQDVDKTHIYCSELVAATYKHLGLLTKHHVSNAYAPKDLSSDGNMRLLNRAWLGPEVYIDMTK